MKKFKEYLQEGLVQEAPGDVIDPSKENDEILTEVIQDTFEDLNMDAYIKAKKVRRKGKEDEHTEFRFRIRTQNSDLKVVVGEFTSSWNMAKGAYTFMDAPTGMFAIKETKAAFEKHLSGVFRFRASWMR